MSVDLVIEVLPTYLLAIDLAREIGRPLAQPELARFFGQGEAIFGRVIAAAAPVSCQTKPGSLPVGSSPSSSPARRPGSLPIRRPFVPPPSICSACTSPGSASIQPASTRR